MARNMEFYRDRSALGWSFLFPFLIVAGFSLIFSDQDQNLYKAGIVERPGEALTEDLRDLFSKMKYIDMISLAEAETGIEKLKHHKIDILIQPSDGRYWINDSSPRGYVVEKILISASVGKDSGFSKQFVTGDQITYSEWLFPGILGMNMMFSALFGVGYTVVRYRKNGLLKRLSVTPVRAFEYLTAQVFSRFFIMLVTTSIVYISCMYFYNFECRGSVFALLAVFSAGAFSMISIGLFVAARISSEELAGGLLNLISWPMMFLSGVWFSLEGTASWVRMASKTLPLTHLIEGARKVMNDGAGFYEIRYQLMVLIIMSAVFIITGSAMFQWKKE